MTTSKLHCNMIIVADTYMATPRGVEFQQPDRIRWIVQGSFKGRLRKVHRALVGDAIFECERFRTLSGNRILWKKGESEGAKQAIGYGSHGANGVFLSCWSSSLLWYRRLDIIIVETLQSEARANGYLWNPAEGARIDYL
jgi:hypothetical protein